MSKEIFITGANSTVGIALVKSIVNDYDKVICHYGHNSEELDKLNKIYGEKLIIFQADLSKENEIQLMLEELNKRGLSPSAYVHLAASRFEYVKFMKSDLKPFKKQMQITYFAFIQIVQALLPAMVKRKSGKVIAMLTSYTVTHQPSYMADYTSSKFALLGLLKSLATEYEGKNVQINGVSPEMIDTRFIEKLPSYVVENTIKERATGRLLSVDDVVPVFKWLLSEESNSVTGQNILIS